MKYIIRTISIVSSGCSTSSCHRLSLWRRPVLVMAPLGIVTAMELVFAAMFVILLIWSLANYLHISFGHLHMHKVGEKVYVPTSLHFNLFRIVFVFRIFRNKNNIMVVQSSHSWFLQNEISFQHKYLFLLLPFFL